MDRTTWILLALAGGSVALVHRDPWADAERAPVYVTNRGAQTKLLPELPEGVPADVQIELVRSGGVVTRIAPDPERAGHWVWDDGKSIGPADPDALDGLWASLGGAVTLRGAEAGTDAGLGESGTIRVRATGIAFELVLGRPTADGVGVYGATDASALWVVERQMADTVAQKADAWVARRPLLVDVAEVVRIDFADATLARGEDRLWRSTVGSTTTLLANTAVDARLGRLLGARLDPWQPPFVDASSAGTPWIRLHTSDAEPHALWRGDDCANGRVAVDRGAGLAGCVDARLLEPWPLPGRPEAGTTWIEPRLVPYEIGRIMRIEQYAPHATTLRSVGGQWILEHEDGKQVTTLGAAEVHRWYAAVHAARLRTEAPPADAPSAIELLVTTDSTQQLRLRCADTDEGMICARDDEPAYPVTIDVELAFTADAFADRELASVAPGDARAIEIGGASTVRQGAHLDLGVWRLDAPTHPEGDAALDEQRLEALVATISSLRAQAWTEAPTEPAPLQIRLELVPAEGRAAAVEVELWSGCIARVDGGKSAKIGEGACRSLGEMLLVDAPLERAIEDATSLEITLGPTAYALRREGARWARVDGEPLGEVGDALRRWPLLRARALVPGSPPGAPAASLAVEPRAGEPYVLEVGDGWARIRGEAWFYALERRDDDAPLPDEPSADPNADQAG